MSTQATKRRPSRGWRRGTVTIAATALALGTFTGAATAAAPDPADAVEVFERDVYEIVGSTLRNPTATTDPSAPLFNVAGVGLNRTWGQWSAATATSQVRSSGGRSPKTDVRLSFTGLVPNGVYSVFYGTLLPDSENPLCPGVERTLPLPSIDPAQSPDSSSFVAASTGTASFRGKLNGNLLGSASQVFFSVIYHFDGQTYGSLPNRGEFESRPGPHSTLPPASWPAHSSRTIAPDPDAEQDNEGMPSHRVGLAFPLWFDLGCPVAALVVAIVPDFDPTWQT